MFDALAVHSEIVSAIARSAVDGDSGTLWSQRHELYRDNIGEAEYRRVLYIDGTPVLKLRNQGYRCYFGDFLPIFAQLIPWHGEYRALHVCRGAVTRRAGKKAGPRQRPLEFGDAYHLVRSEAILGRPAEIHAQHKPGRDYRQPHRQQYRHDSLSEVHPSPVVALGKLSMTYAVGAARAAQRVSVLAHGGFRP